MKRAWAAVFRFFTLPAGRLAGAASAMRRASLPVAMALIVGMFNPLFCVVHCAVTDAAARQETPPGSARFVCHLIGGSPSSAADQGHIPDQKPSTPRAVYESVLIVTILCTALLLFTARLTPSARPRWRGEATAPPPPPPKPSPLLPAGA